MFMSDITKKIETDPQPGELTNEALEQVTGGAAVKTVPWSNDNESPKEEVTFVYGQLQVGNY